MSNELHKLPLGVGLLAHVDAGKTTLSEALLYESGAKRTLGRVDHGDTCLDTHSLEREKAQYIVKAVLHIFKKSWTF